MLQQEKVTGFAEIIVHKIGNKDSAQVEVSEGNGTFKMGYPMIKISFTDSQHRKDSTTFTTAMQPDMIHY